ncbi:60S Ribosomal Protein L10A [Manis pentadactyla]|nr:60S Ribosomal Protein L10A [Manis pentadactyla]
MVELQISLKNYDPQKDKQFSGTIRLKSTPRPKLSVCVFGDQQHGEEVKAVDMPHMDIEALKKLSKNMKLVKKLARKYDTFLASESLIKEDFPRTRRPPAAAVGLKSGSADPGVKQHGCCQPGPHGSRAPQAHPGYLGHCPHHPGHHCHHDLPVALPGHCGHHLSHADSPCPQRGCLRISQEGQFWFQKLWR